MGYLILNSEKMATHNFKGTDGKTWDEVKDFRNIAQIVPKPFVVYDFDNRIEAEIMLKIIDGLGIKTKVMKTTRGIHCYFRSDKPMKCSSHQRSAIGLTFDRKSHSKNAYVVIKKDGVMREWIRECADEEIEEVPVWLTVCNKRSENTRFVGLKNGDGRNGKLHPYILTLQGGGMSKDDIKTTLNIINNYVFDEPMSESELNLIMRDDAFKTTEEVEQYNEEFGVGKFNHITVAERVMEFMKFITVNNMLYYKDNEIYKTNDLMVKKKLNQVHLGIKEHQRREVIHYLKSETVIDPDTLPVEPYILAIRNTKINVLTGELIPYTEEDVLFNIVDVRYNPKARCEAVDNVLNNVFNGKQELIDLFFEMIGCCLVKESVKESAFMLLGSGSNGKSTILMMLQYFLKGNYSTLGLEELTDRFSTCQLENKLANIGDDIDSNALKNTGKIKKIIAGNEITVEHKGFEPFQINPTCTHIYSCNKLPRSYDKSNGFYRRFVIIPFNANFNDKNSNFKPLIITDLRTEEAKSYLLLKGMEAIQRVYARGIRFTEVEEVNELAESYKIENSTVMSWIEDEGLTESDMLKETRNDLYIRYTSWCANSNVKNPVTIRHFYEEVRIKYGFEKKPSQKANGKRYFRKEIKIEFDFESDLEG